MPPEQGQAGLDINALMQMLMQMLTASPELPVGDVPTNTPSTAAPANMRVLSENDQMMSLLMSIMQQTGMGQSGQQSMNAAAGVQGGPMGGMGGRPIGS